METDSSIIIRNATPQDAEGIAGIYNHYIENTVITFEEEPVSPNDFAKRIGDVLSASLPWLVAEQDGTILGYAYATPWKQRAAYRFSAEATIYLHPASGGQGIGSRLYGELLPTLQQRGIHAVMGGIALPNSASVALHEKFGFRKVAHFEEVGFKFGRWVDVGYWECVLGGV